MTSDQRVVWRLGPRGTTSFEALGGLTIHHPLRAFLYDLPPSLEAGEPCLPSA